MINCNYVGKTINPDYLQLFLMAEWLQLIASTINWRLSWQRLWALVSNHLRYNVKSLNIKLSEENDGVVLFSTKVGFCHIRFQLHISTSEYMSFIWSSIHSFLIESEFGRTEIAYQNSFARKNPSKEFRNAIFNIE